MDGTGAPGYLADVAVKGDAIIAMGQIEGGGLRTIDATGKVVAPGFIDLHSHADFQFFIDPTADSKITQGVTLELVGNCGMSFCAPLYRPIEGGPRDPGGMVRDRLAANMDELL